MERHLFTVSAMNSLKDTKLTLAMNCHRIVILYNEKMNNERTDTKFGRLVIFFYDKKTNFKSFFSKYYYLVLSINYKHISTS